MIMRQGQQLLLPANPFFIWMTLLAAFVLNMLQNMGLWGRAAWVPDLLALVLVFWSVHQPLRVGIGAAFVFGLAMDVHQGGLLGANALALPGGHRDGIKSRFVRAPSGDVGMVGEAI